MPPSYIRVRAVVWAYGRGQTDSQTHTHKHTDACDHNTFCVVYDSRKNVTTTLLLLLSNYYNHHHHFTAIIQDNLPIIHVSLC